MKKILRAFIFLTLGVLVFVLISDLVISSYKSDCYTSVNEVKPAKVGLVLGTSKYVKGGRINLYYQYRLDATKKLFDAIKIEYVLVSGDNSTTHYDEPNTFKEDLIKMGIPKEKIYLDYAGFRTLDSVVRAKEVFQEEDFIIISQPFHNERALYIAKHKNIQAKAFNSKEVGKRYGLKTKLREKLARVKTVLDIYLLNTQPKFLGEKISIK